MRLIPLGRWGYRISDTDAGRLSKAVGRALPKQDHVLSVVLPQGEEAQLFRTMLAGEERSKMPKRGWVWYVQLVNADSEVARRYAKAPKLNRAALAKAKEAALHGRRLEQRLTQSRSTRWKVRIIWGQAWRARLRREAAHMYMVAGDAYEEAGDMLLAMRYRTNADKLINEHRLSGELERRDPKPRERRRRRRLK